MTRDSETKREAMMRKRAARIIGGCAALVVLAMLGASAFLAFVVSSQGSFPFIYGLGDPRTYPRIDPAPSLAPKWSDDGSLIAFAVVTDPAARWSGADDSGSPDFGVVHYVAAADGSGVWQVERGFAAEPSRDGSRIIYATDRYSPEVRPNSAIPPVNYEIETAATDGSDRRRLTDDPTPDILPARSPDGSQIAFVKHGDDYSYQGVYAMNGDGSGLRQVAPPNRYTREADEYVAEVWDISVKGPVWSPAGDYMAFITEEASSGVRGPYAWSLYTVRPNGSELRLLFRQNVNIRTAPRLRSKMLSFPAWSPDGRTVAFITFEGGKGTLRIKLVGQDSSLSETISLGQGTNGATFVIGAESHVPSLEWSPDGSHLMFSSWSSHFTAQLYLVDADGENMRQIGDHANATFSPDGSRIAAVSQRYSYSEPVLYTMDLNGSDIRPLVARGEDGKLKAVNAPPPNWWERLWDMVTP